jgi:ubiquinone/menaquinone biosynthesis C-methylase UbiE
MTPNLENAVAAHYARPGLAEAITDGLRKAGADPDAPTLQDLAPVDEFHTAGRLSTLKALEITPIEAGMHVLDAGCGIGGSARHLAKEHACRVTGIDLTSEYVDVARLLTGRMGLSQACTFHQGSVLDMPVADTSFDAGVTFHVAMNIEDRERFYSELARVLRPNAPLCIFDVMKGPTPGMIYPVPWAETEVTSFLKSREETCSLLRDAGFRIIAEQNLRDFAIDYFRDALAKAAKASAPPPLGLHLLTRDNAPEKFRNYAQALEEHRIEPVIVVARRN